MLTGLIATVIYGNFTGSVHEYEIYCFDSESSVGVYVYTAIRNN